jgi:hypothetical protein
MEAFDFWHKLFIRGNKTFIVSLTACLFLTPNVFAQRNPNKAKKVATVVNLMNYDKRKLHFGMFMGGFGGRYMVERNQRLLTDPSQGNARINDIESRLVPGLMVGAIVNYKITNAHWNFRTTPGIGFLYEPSLYYQVNNEPAYIRLGNQVSTFEMPLYLVYKSERRVNSRMYMFAGPNYQMQMSNKALDPRASPLGADTELNISNVNLELSYGFGFHFYLSFFNFAPEIRFYHGLFNLHQQSSQETLVNSVIDKIHTHRIAILINFEG